MKKIYALLAAVLSLNTLASSDNSNDKKKTQYIIIDSSKLDEDGYIRTEDLDEYIVPNSRFTPQEQIRIQQQIRESTRPQTNEKG